MRKSLLLLCGLTLLAGSAQAQSSASQLHDALHLTAGQEDAWRAYQATVGGDPEQQARAEAAARLAPTLPTPRRLALIRAQMQADLVTFDRDARAVNTFYAALTPDQQRAFDRQTATMAQPAR